MSDFYTADLDGPDDADLIEVEDDLDDGDPYDEADYGYAAVDDRYNGSGIPAWSVWA